MAAVLGKGQLVLALRGHMTASAMDAALGALPVGAGATLIVDCGQMTGYDAEARARFVDWHRQHRDRIRAVAVLTENTLWQMIVSAMSLASGQRMRAFATRVAAEAWLSDR